MKTNLFALAVASCAISGCGGGEGTAPVLGQVVFEDGTPLTTGGVVLTELVVEQGQGGAGSNARGAIDDQGRFQLSTFSDNDGAKLGTHRVIIKADRDAKDYTERGMIPRPVIDEKFEEYHTSGLELVVADEENEVTFTVTKPGKKKR